MSFLAWLLFASLFLVCLASRLLGYWASGLFPIPPRVHRFLELLPGPLLSSLLAVAAVSMGGFGGIAAIGTALLVMVATRSEFTSVTAGAAAGWLVGYGHTLV